MDYGQIVKEQLNNVIDHDQMKGIDEIGNQASEISKGLSDQFSFEDIIDATLNGESIFDSGQLIESLKGLIVYEVRSAMIIGTEILLICIAIGLLNNLASSFGKKSVSEVSLLICIMIIVGISIKSFDTAYELCMDSVTVMVNTMEILTPVLIGVLIATGNITSGTVFSPVIIGAVTGTGILLKKIILPAMFAATIMALINCLTEKNYVNKLSKLIRNLAVGMTGLILAIMSGIITVQGLITETSDGLIINTAKYSLNTFIPIVGGFTSDTVELFLRCMGSIKSIVGVFGIITLVLIIAVPIIKILIIALIYKLTAAAAEPIAESKISDGLNDMGSCLVSMASIMFFAALLFIIFISVIVGTGNAG